jgi:hypothetical protein
METITVTELKSSSSSGRSSHNLISWQYINGKQTIIAVGAPEDWNSTAALPPSTVTTDLVVAATEDPELAKLLWREFINYLVVPNLPIWHFALPHFLRPRVLISLRLPDKDTSLAVFAAIQQSRSPLRLRVENAA